MISIIMGTYNGQAYLKEQLDSILNQDYKNWKLFLFDDGSSDQTAEIADAYVKCYPKKIYFLRNQQNFGAKGNFFQGVRRVLDELSPESSYFAFADQDDVWTGDHLSYSIQKMKELEKEEKKPVLVFSDVHIVDEALNVKSPSFVSASGFNMKKLNFSSLLMENKAVGGTILFNRSLALLEWEAEKRMGRLPSGAKMHDWWFVLLAAVFGKITFLNVVTEEYRQHGNNVVGGENFSSYLKKRISAMSEIRERINENIQQGKEFLRFFEEILPSEELHILRDFVQIEKSGWLKKRVLLIKREFYKSGLLRNIALFIFI